MANKNWLDGSANWITAADWSGGTVPASGDDVTVYQGDPNATAPITIHSLTAIAPGNVDLRDTGSTASQITGNLTNGGGFFVDRFGGDGGSALTIGGTFTNSGNTQIGNGSLTAATTVTTAKLVNTGTIELDGSTKQASLQVGGAAGFGAAGSLTGTLRLFGDTLVSFASGAIRSLANNSTLRLDGASARVAIAGSTGSNSALTTLSSIGRNATMIMDNGSTLTDTVSLTNYGTLTTDYFGGDGGASLTLTQKLTNIGYLQIGNGSLSAASTVSVGVLDNRGTIELDGSATQKASLLVDFTAGFGTPYTVTGTVRLFGNTLVQFASGTITTIAANGYLRLDGANAFVADAGSTTSNSALTGLRTVDHNGTFLIGNGSSVGITNYIDNYGTIGIDYFGGQGSSSMTVGSKLNNVGYLQIGNGALSASATVTTAFLTNTGTIELDGNGANKASLIVGRPAGFGTPGSVTGAVRLFGNSLVQFTAGQISSLAAQSYLRIDGTSAFVADAGQTTSNSALKGLRTINAGAQFFLDNGASVTTTSFMNNSGSLLLDYFGGEGGASVTIGGRLSNTGSVQVGNGNLSAATTLTVASLSGTGSLSLYGNGSSRASVIVNSAAGTGTPGHLQGNVYLQDNALLQFSSGQIATIDTGATLRLNGTTAHVADAGNTGSNSALTGLSENDGTIFLDNGAALAVSGDLANYGAINLDYYGGEGGSLLNVGGLFDNENNLSIGNGGASGATTMTVASLINGGSIALSGSASGRGALSVGTAAGTGTAGELSGSVVLQGNSVLAFASGQIGTIATGATLRLIGATAYVADAGSVTSNSALTGLSENDGTFNLENGATISTTGDFANTSYIYLDPYGGEGGSNLTVNGRFDNSGNVTLGNGAESSAVTLTAASLLNDGSITSYGNSGASQYATLAIAGSVVNNGSINLVSDQQTFAGNLTGFGTVSVANNSTLTLNGNAGGTQTIHFAGADTLVLGSAKTFAASIDNFAAGDFLDLKSFASSSSLSYAENGAGTAGVLTVTSGANVAKLNFDGNFATTDFTKASDGSGGLLIGHA